MTSEQKYKKELEGIAASESFKQSTLQLLLDTAEKEGLNEGQPIKPDTPRPWYVVYRRQMLAAACVALVAGVGLFSLRGYNSTSSGIQVEMAAPAENRMEAAPEAMAGEAAEAYEEAAEEPQDTAPQAQSTLPSRYFIGPLVPHEMEGNYFELLPDSGASLPPNEPADHSDGRQEDAVQEEDDSADASSLLGTADNSKESASFPPDPAIGEPEGSVELPSTTETADEEQPADPNPIVVGQAVFNDMDFESVVLEDIEEHGSRMLGDEDIPDTLPVFANNAQRNDLFNSEIDEETGAALSNSYLGDYELTCIAEDIASALGLGENESVRNVSQGAGLATDYVEAEFVYGSVWAYADGSAMVSMDAAAAPGLSREPSRDSTAEEQAAWALEAVEYFSDLFYGMQAPYAEANLSRSFSGDPHWQVTVHDAGSGDEAELIVNRSLVGAVITYSYGTVTIYLQNYDATDPLGDYPTITAEEATALLNGGKALTTVPYAYPGEEYIAGIDLVYRTNGYEEYFIPYYRFWVELPEDEYNLLEDGLKQYGVWYVPAIEGEYIVFTGDALEYFK